MESAEHESIIGVCGRSPSGVQGKAAAEGVRGRRPLKLKDSPYFRVSKVFYGSPVLHGTDRKRGGAGSPLPLNPPLRSLIERSENQIACQEFQTSLYSLSYRSTNRRRRNTMKL